MSLQEWAAELTEKWEEKCRQAGFPGVPVVLRGRVVGEPELVWESED